MGGGPRIVRPGCTLRCAIAKKNSLISLVEQKSLTDFFVCVFILFLHFKCIIYFKYFFAKSDLDLSIDFFRIYFVSFGSFFAK